MSSTALRLFDAGYAPIPILPGQKRPAISKWSRWCTELPSEAQVEAWAREHPDCGWGIACGNVVAIDIDAEDAGRAAHLAGLAVEVFGPTPAVRIGRAPRRLLVYRASSAIGSRSIGDVEILSAGKQFVAVHIHPQTGKPYSWPIEHLADIPLYALPAITAEQVDQFLDRAVGERPDGHESGKFQATSHSDYAVNPASGLVTDGREAWLASCVWRAHWDAISAGGRSDANAVGVRAWQIFRATTDLARPHGNRTWRRTDALVKARAIVAKARAGRLPHQKVRPGLTFVILGADAVADRVSVAEARQRLDAAIGGFFAQALGAAT